MSKTKKILIISSVVAIIVGFIISVCDLAAMNFDFTKLNTIKSEIKTYTVTEKFNNININVSSENIKFKMSETEKCEVICNADEDISYYVEVIDDTLNVSYKDNRKWYFFYFSINFNFPEITVSLPKNAYKSLYINSSSGSIEIPGGFSFSNADVYSSSGEINYFADTANKLAAETSSGDLTVGNIKSQNISAKSLSGDINIFSSDIKNNLDVNTSSGDIELSDITASNISAECLSGDLEFMNVIASGNINAETASGDIDLNKSDGKNLYISSMSGDVYGSLLTEKTFITNTMSGDVDIPYYSVSSGKCEVSTASGDITMVVK